MASEQSFSSTRKRKTSSILYFHQWDPCCHDWIVLWPVEERWSIYWISQRDFAVALICEDSRQARLNSHWALVSLLPPTVSPITVSPPPGTATAGWTSRYEPFLLFPGKWQISPTVAVRSGNVSTGLLLNALFGPNVPFFFAVYGVILNTNTNIWAAGFRIGPELKRAQWIWL